MAESTKLWLDVSSTKRGAQALVSLSKCRNCGKTKATSDPCGFDHLAAVMEFRADVETMAGTDASGRSCAAEGDDRG